MASFYYAVKKGKNPGIYETWSECKEEVTGFKGAKYKKFPTYKEAQDFVDDTGDFQRPEEENLKANEIMVYVDGSFCLKSWTYSYGVVAITDKGIETYNGREDDKELAQMRNVSGEIKGAMVAMEIALEKGKEILYLYFDYEGIEQWAKGSWKTNKQGTIDYKSYYDSIKDKLKVVFIKVKAHSGVEYNELADKLAKEAL